MELFKNFAVAIIDTKKDLPNVPAIDANSVFIGVINAVYLGAGIVAVLTIIIAGYMYTISGGNSGEVQKAKDAIMYAIIGLIVIGFAFMITQFIIGRF